MRLILSGGGTGGHVFPLISLALHLLKKGLPPGDILFLGQGDSLEEQEAKKIGLRFAKLIPQSNRRDLLGIVFSLFLAFLGSIQALFLFLSFRPDAVVGGGGFVSLPAILASRISKTPYFLLEQNMIPGKLTRFFSRSADTTFLTFPGSEKFLKGKFLVVGNPIREDLLLPREEARRILNLPQEAFLVILAGGSKGARSLNREFQKLVPFLLSKPQCFVLWVTGRGDHEAIREQLKPTSERLFLKPFEPQMPLWISGSDLYIGRAGAGLLWEAVSCGVPSILIPFPYAADDHQMANARFLEEAGASVVVPESEIENLLLTVRALFEDQEKLKIMRECALKIPGRDATSKICSVLWERFQK
ncbi:MAG: UDP-N-acetylglucosamine--N-acetylmuramyl-(pentapeptide) pyrophosphoryl-undecaprenol N-acetylglucosamine transferase [Caldiserica bacterium]|jgi:UDP-N-acetylglucosamine--N-acetylmuramyl-(pentapeptide) pyrophosphoryl-undecaprenol N-acetylglucosamine transferase|nr:UDP-N-acetylglucosamine--N-acetylmuramyl-(pentapeptide) pyrophosphoryl-undecaprenol N-acetylglucosamine transferase [Caldisericota bacterium]MDH7562990.1 UDP-N-acetylglucosamine--N-acetylmuramyl-(pentapeptide) pyrophosphoryl-undecaprenol N-acetylglucosamine transferase [Caldisericota bacterium]